MGTEVKIIPRMRSVYKDTKANLDALTGLKDGDLGYATDETILYRQNGAGTANWEAISENASALIATHAGLPNAHHTKTVATSGSYSGNDTANRAIAHGLGATPKLVIIITPESAFYWYRLVAGSDYVYCAGITSGGYMHAVTAMNGTNFYVGNATSYLQSANGSGYNFYWVAIG